MAKKKRTDKQMYFLSKAILHSICQFGWANKNFVYLSQEDWKSNIIENTNIDADFLTSLTDILPERTLTHSNETKVRDSYYYVRKDGYIYIYINGSVTTYTNLTRNWNRILRAETWPKLSSINALITLSFFAKVADDKNFKEFALRDIDTNATLISALDNIKAYRKYLDSSDQENMMEYNDFNYKNSNDTIITTPSDVEIYVRASIDYIEKYINDCNSIYHTKIFEQFKYQLVSIQTDANLESEFSGGDLSCYLTEIRDLSFSVEKQLLHESLKHGSNLSIYFSDSGFTDNGNKPVWSLDPSRKRILRVLRKAKIMNTSLTYYRILLLDSIKEDEYTDEELLMLCRDIVFLLEHYVDVMIGDRKIAKQIDIDLYNYAIIDDGTIMRAGKKHVEWRIAKVSTSNNEYKTLLDNYKQMMSNINNKLHFKVKEISDTDLWIDSSIDRAQSVILPILKEWLV